MKKNDDGFTIVYDSKKQSSFGNSNPVYEDNTKKIIKNYDNNGRQTSEFSEKKKEDYFMDKKTGDKILTEPCVFDNYINKKYMWRDSDFILMKESEKHVFDSTDDTFIKNRDKDSFLIGIDHNPDNLEMSRSHHFFGISSGDFELYRNGLISVEDIWDYTRPRYRVMDIFHL